MPAAPEATLGAGPVSTLHRILFTACLSFILTKKGWGGALPRMDALHFVGTGFVSQFRFLV